MANEKIHEYLSSRTSGTLLTTDEMDVDASDDAGSTWFSARITVANLLSYINNNGQNIYATDGTITSNRTLTSSTFFTKWLGGNVVVKMADAINDYGFLIEDDLGAEHGRFGFDQTTSSAELILNNSTGTFFHAKDGFVGIGTNAQALSEEFRVSGDVKIDFGIGVLGENPSAGVAIRTGANTTALSYGSSGGAAIYQFGGVNTINSASTGSPLRIELGLIKAAEFIQNEDSQFETKLKIIHQGADAVTTLRDARIDLISGYWDGALSQNKIAQINHNITASPAGTSQLDFSIAAIDLLRLDEDSTAGNTRFWIYDVDNATLERVTVGAADSGGTNFKLLRIPN